MSNTGKIIIGVVVLIIVVFVGWMLYPTAPVVDTTVSDVKKETTVEPTPTPVVKNDMTTSASDSSDAAIQADLNSTDAQINNLGTDSTNVNTSVNNSSTAQ